MGELKHGFGAAKMNKDLDERTVPNGEYRDALNIEVLTSEGSDVGSMQTLMGNTKISDWADSYSTMTPGLISNTAKCVGSIADEKNNNLYYFIADPNNFTDYILQYNSDTKILTPIVVDKYQVNTSISIATNPLPGDITTHLIIHRSTSGGIINTTNIRPGMTVAGNFYKTTNTPMGPTSQPFVVDHSDGLIVIRMEEYIDPVDPTIIGWKIYLDETTIDHDIFSGGITSNEGVNISFRANRALNFSHHKYSVSTGNLISIDFPFITGINIIDGILFWTDGRTEPKKIIVDNFTKDIFPGKYGTDPSGEIHSFFNVYTTNTNISNNSHETSSNGLINTDLFDSIDFRKQPGALKEEHITIIKKPPLHPPTLLMNNTSDGRITSTSQQADLTGTLNSVHFMDFNENNLSPGDTKDVTFVSPFPDYVVGDLILLRKDDPFISPFDDLDDYELIVEILEYNDSTGVAKVKINFIQNNKVNEITGGTPDPATFYSMLQQEKPLYEFKLPKFAFRYKYQDNQYSTYSPFSDVAFLPGDFNYVPKDGYNLGMVNTLRSVYIMDFVPDEDSIPKDVIEIDILYKESNSTNIYLVKTIKYGDEEWFAIGSPVNTNSAKIYARTTGRIQITSEMVRSAIASNQLLRPWDNVPRAAKAQEIVGNRIVYANYLQNYNL